MNGLDLYGYFFSLVFYRLFANICSFLFASHSHPCWISYTLTCTFCFHVYFLDFLSMIAHFCLPVILFPAELFNHTHFLHSNIIFMTLDAMTESTPAKLHPTCANDHDVRVCHWTTANTSQLPQMHWLLLYCVNGTLLGHAMLCLKN